MKKDMGGLRKHMPITFATFMVGTGALMGIFPLSGFWSKDEILAGANGLRRRRRLQARCWSWASSARLHVRLHDPGCIWYVFCGEPRGAAAAHTPHESGPRITVPLVILAALGVVAGFANLPDTGVLDWVPESFALRFEHFVEPTGAYFPGAVDAASRHPEFTLWIALVSTAVAAARRRPRLPLVLEGQGPPRHHRAHQGRPGPATRCSRTSTTWTSSTPTSSPAA